MNALHLLIEEWVDRQPDACAVRDASTNRELTFRQLWQHSGHLADQLRARGVKRGDFVGVAMHRSVDMIVGVLGIIRAGAAYLALDAHAPVDRIAMMLADADVRLVVEAHACTGGPAHRWQLPEGVHRLAVSTAIGSTLSGEPDHTTVSVSGASPAYVAYTSGSTGRPKGVVVPHRAVIRLVMSPNYCTIAPGDRVANSSNPAFDAMTFEVWSTLTAGGTLVVLPTVTDLALDRWVDMIRAERITTMFLTTSLFHMVARERPTAFRTVDTLIVGGEQLEFAAVRRVLAKGPPQRLLNAYGPTETTTFASYYECTVDSLAGCERVPIGYALQNTRLRVVDGDLRPVRPGEPGELCIGRSGGCTRLPAPSGAHHGEVRARVAGRRSSGRNDVPHRRLGSRAAERGAGAAWAARPPDQAPGLSDRAGGDRTGSGRHRSGGCGLRGEARARPFRDTDRLRASGGIRAAATSGSVRDVVRRAGSTAAGVHDSCSLERPGGSASGSHR